MRKPLNDKVRDTVRSLREVWAKIGDKHAFVAFSTGKDSLALAAILYEAVEPEQPVCLYVHHDLEFPTNLEYLATIKECGFRVQVLRPFLEYFELIDRGIGFVTLRDPWCVPMLIGTALLDWLQQRGARSPRDGVMFRGMSGSEYSQRFHTGLELYDQLDLPTFNPLLNYTKDEILELISKRYGLPLNPIYEHMDRTYCICCYTSDRRRQAYSSMNFPDVCRRYYADIERMLFGSGLIDRSGLPEEFRSREEKLDRHGFIYWRRTGAQNVVGAVKRRLSPSVLAYRIRDPNWIAPKHLRPVDGRWTQRGAEIRFWDVPERQTDALIKRMINCLDCGFCMVECFPCRRFDRDKKALQVSGCVQCGKCLRLRFCMGWRHRFWRRVIVEEH